MSQAGEHVIPIGFAPPGRDTDDELRRKVAALGDVPLLRETLNAMPSMVAVLNSNRQIVAANEAFLRVLEVSEIEVAQKRPGEALGCIRVLEGVDGCGTGPHCRTCGAVQAILESQRQTTRVVRECRVLVNTPTGVAPLDLRVTATPIKVGNDRLIVAAIEDVSQAKRLAVLQRVFFHDVLNTAGCIHGYAEYLQGEPVQDESVSERLTRLSRQLIEEIRAQQDLLHAESGDLEIQAKPLKLRQLIEELRDEYLAHPAAEERIVEVGSVWEGMIESDYRLLRRVLGNMLKNALEASLAGQVVTLACTEHANCVTFSVHNPGAMSEEAKMQIFQRSFSTKGQTGRGIGTYSMKLLGERYLGGKVAFSSEPSQGTTFTLTLPKLR